MALTIPRTIRQGWGQEVTAEFEPWLEAKVYDLIQAEGVGRDEFQAILSRLNGLDKDAVLIKEALFQMRSEFREDLAQLRHEVNEGFARVDERFAQVYERFDRMGERFDQMHHQMAVQTRWLIGSLALIGTVVSVLLAIAQFTP